jgi:hypothetical protein
MPRSDWNASTHALSCSGELRRATEAVLWRWFQFLPPWIFSHYAISFLTDDIIRLRSLTKTNAEIRRKFDDLERLGAKYDRYPTVPATWPHVSRNDVVCRPSKR